MMQNTMSLTPKDRIAIIIFKIFHDPNKPKTKEMCDLSHFKSLREEKIKEQKD